MSVTVDTPKVEETTPVTKPVASTEQTTAPATTEGITAAPATTETPVTETTARDEAVVEATPATEGNLLYKAPGLLNLLRKNKHFFWFSEEPLTQEALDSYIKNEKHEGHHNAAWAQETGKGVMFYAKRAEDKTHPAGLIIVAEATGVTKVGSTDFSFKVGSHAHKFEATSAAERDSWVVAIQKIVDDSEHLKAEVTGRESYKKTIEGYAFSPAIAGSAPKASAPKKSLDAATATDAAAVEPVRTADTSSASSVDESKKAEKQAKKERSQSRKRSSVFQLFGKKDEEKAEKKAEKEHEKEIKKAEKEHIKEEKKVEAEIKKEEAKADHDAIKAKEAAEAAAIAAVPAVAASSDKKEERPIEEVTTPTEKKNKRASVFGGFFNKSKVTSPPVEKTEKEVAPEVPAKDETLAVSENAPKLDEPIHTKPIDTAAVTAPVDTIETPAATTAPVVADEHKTVEPVSTSDAVTPRTEKKSFLAGVFKKHDKKEEPKEEIKTNEEAAKEVAPITTAEPTTLTTEPTTQTPVKDAEIAKEERPAREKRRTSLFGSLGTLKRKNEKSPEPSSVAATSTTADETFSSAPRSKSPIPRLGGLFRKPSRAAKTELATEETKTDAIKTETATDSPAVVDTPANATIIEPKSESAIVGDVVPENLTSVHDAVTTSKPEEVKATA